MKATKVAAAVAAIGLVVLVPAAAAKDFKPGDLRVCARAHCVPITNQGVLTALGAFYYGNVKPTRAPSPRRGTPYVELQFRNGYTTGIAAGVRFDRFLSFGVNLDQFAARTWYVMPARAAAEIRRLAARLRPQAVTAGVLDRSH